MTVVTGDGSLSHDNDIFLSGRMACGRNLVFPTAEMFLPLRLRGLISLHIIYHSTATCILMVTDIIYRNMNDGRLTGVVFLDLQKAFDTVDHNILLNKLRTFNSSDKSISWFQQYLLGRFQAVRTRGTTSSFLPMTCGVLQGSILGPMLFILYINDLEKYLELSKVSLYADDMALYVQARSQAEIMLDLRLELSMVHEWLKANKLTLNVDKTKYMVFGTKTALVHKPDLNIRIDGEKLERVSVMKYLGVFLDEHLTFSEHISTVCKKSSQKLGILHKAQEFLDRKTSLIVYKSLVVPYMDYCDVVYMVANEGELKNLHLIQNAACRCILPADKRTNTELMHTELNLTRLAEGRKKHLQIECYKNVTNSEGILHSFFTPVANRSQRQTQNTDANNMYVRDIRSVCGRKSFSYRGPVTWNSIHKDVRQAVWVGIFKSHLNKTACREVNHPG